MEHLLIYGVAAILFMALVVHILERYSMVVVSGLVLTAILWFYAPLDSLPKFQENNKQELAEVPKIRDSLINVSPLKKEKKTKKDIFVNQSPEKLFDKGIEPVAKFTSLACNADSTVFNRLVFAESVFTEEKNAKKRVKFLKSNGFINAFYIYLPCYHSRIDDERNLFAVIIIKPCLSMKEMELRRLLCIEEASQQGLELISYDRILEIREK